MASEAPESPTYLHQRYSRSQVAKEEEEEMAQRRGAEAATETEERELSTNSLFMKKVKMHTGGQIDMRDLICGSAMQSMEAIWATSTGNAKAHLQQKGLMKFISEEEPRTFIYARETPVIANCVEQYRMCCGHNSQR